MLDRLRRLAVAGLDVETFWREATGVVAGAVAFDWKPCWFTLDPASLVVTSHFNEDIDELDPAVFRNEYVDEDFNKMADLGAAGSDVVTLYRATGSDVTKSARYRELLSSYGLAHELIAILRSAGTCWGCLTLYRAAGSPDFSDDDLGFVSVAAPLLAEGARRGLLVGQAHDLGPGDGAGAPAVLVLGSDLGIVSMTGTAEGWLAELGGGRERVPAAVRAVAAAALDETIDDVPASRVRTRRGVWASLHGSRLGHGQVAVIVERPSADGLGSLLMAAYGLTAREQDIARHVLHGASTEDAAKALHLSPYTVQDHLKSIFAKTGVRSRRQLIATIFFDHFEPRVRDNEVRVRTGRMMRGGPLSRAQAPAGTGLSY